VEIQGTACKNAGKYCGGEKILSPAWFQHCGASAYVAPAVPTPLVFSSRGVNEALYQPVIGVVLTAIKWAFSVADTDVIHCRSDAVTRQLEHESAETVVYQRRLTKVPLVLIGKQWYQLPELIPTNSNSGVRSCISISIHTQHVT